MRDSVGARRALLRPTVNLQELSYLGVDRSDRNQSCDGRRHRGQVREGTYGSRLRPSSRSAEFIRSATGGKPYQQFWPWVSPNMEFATIFVGIIGIWFFGQTFWTATLAIVLGTALGSLSMGVLAARGPLYGVPQMVLSRLGFGFRGNILPAGINSLVAGVGWFAVNSVSGAFALNALLGWNTKICLVIIVIAQISVAFFGHNFVHIFERISFHSWSSSS